MGNGVGGGFAMPRDDVELFHIASAVAGTGNALFQLLLGRRSWGHKC